ncbi:MAG: hypothetical protein ISP90_06705 [Nevskia sp.]|nr:hypothetical protein [Nevskia sp.]
MAYSPGPKEIAQIQVWGQILRGLVINYRTSDALFGEISRSIMVEPERAARLWENVGPVEWWRLYEKSELRLVFGSVARLGMSELLVEVAESRGLPGLLSPNQDMRVEEFQPNPKNRAAAFAGVYAVWNNMRAVVMFGESLNMLVKRADRDDEAFFNAVRVDPSCLSCAPCRRRMSRAALTQSIGFFKELGGAIQRPKAVQSTRYPELDLSLYLMFRGKVLEHFSEKMLEELFLVRLADLKLYSKDLSSLARYVQRRRDSMATRSSKSLSS